MNGQLKAFLFVNIFVKMFSVIACNGSLVVVLQLLQKIKDASYEINIVYIDRFDVFITIELNGSFESAIR